MQCTRSSIVYYQGSIIEKINNKYIEKEKKKERSILNNTCLSHLTVTMNNLFFF